MSDLIEILYMDGPTWNTFDCHKIFVTKITMSFPASFYSSINCAFSQPCFSIHEHENQFLAHLCKPKVGLHSNNVEILPTQLNKEGLMKLLRGLGRHCYLDNINSFMIK